MLGIILINYNSEAEVIHYIKNELSKVVYTNVIAVVNNSHTTESENQLKMGIQEETNRILDKDIFLITKQQNLGYARANNFGASFLKSKFKLDYVLFSNTDIVFTDKGVVDKLIRQLEILPKDVAAIGPRVLGSDGFDQSPKVEISFIRYFAWRLLPFLKGKFGFLQKKTAANDSALQESYCYQLSGCFLLVKMDDFSNAGMFDDYTFLYGEEKILAERLKQIGKKNYYYSKVGILHQESSIIGQHNNAKQIKRMLHRNNCYYYKAYKNVPSAVIFLLKFI